MKRTSSSDPGNKIAEGIERAHHSIFELRFGSPSLEDR